MANEVYNILQEFIIVSGRTIMSTMPRRKCFI